jgi:hypothetical protein
VLQRALVRRDEVAERAVVLAQDVEQILGRSRLGEGGETAQVAKQARDVRAVPGQQLLALCARDQLRDLRRDEAGELGPLALDRVEQARVRDRDRGLIGERLDERDVLVGTPSMARKNRGPA